MSITVVKEGKGLRIVHATDDVPGGVEFELFTRNELVNPWTAATLESAFADGEDWGDLLDELVLNEAS
jgi:hypothetical protein